jgi:hypothetical protein
MFVTSIAEVTAPGIDNFLVVLFDDRFDFTKLLSVQPVIVRKFNLRFQPVLGLTVPAIGVNMNARLLTREEVQTISILAKDCGTQARLLFGHHANGA